jgi:CheY-like chemotaxis protein
MGPQSRRILIVEDEPVTAARLADLVRNLGAEVVGPTASVTQALACADRVQVDGALLDLNVAGVPVYAVADRLALRGVPFVFLTAHADAVPPAYADRPVLDKPYRTAEVAQVLVATLDGSGRPAAERCPRP